MKKTILFLSFAALVALVGCQRESFQAQASEEEDGVKEVTTQFVLNVTAAPTTKMSASVVQQAGNFRGIQDGALFVYKTGMDGTPYVLNQNATPEKTYDFGMFFASGGLDNGSTTDNGVPPTTTQNNETSSSRRVLQLSVPVNVDAAMFYGKAIKATGVPDAEFGSTTATNATTGLAGVSAKPSERMFSAKTILGDVSDKYDATARLMIAVINHILACSVGDDGSVDVGDVTYDNLPAISWAQLGHQYELDNYPSETRYANSQANIDNKIILGRPVEGLEEILGKCYYLFTYIRPSDAENPYDPVTQADEYAAYVPVRPNGEYRAGSSAAIKAMVSDMYKVISAASQADPTNAKEANAKRLAEVILDRSLLYFDQTDGSYKSISAIKELLVSQYGIVSAAQWNANYAGAMDLNKYPFENFGVPEGAAQLGFHVYGSVRPEGEGGGTYPADAFYYYHPNKPLVNPLMTEFEPRKYLFPAELWYYVNSPIRTTSSDVAIDDYPNGVTPWNTASSWTGWTYPGKVASATRGVAVANSINYGVALLKSNVVYKEGVTVLQDNRYEMTNHVEANNTINVSAAQLELRGILVGGVNPRMNWQFTRFYTAAETPSASNDLSKFDGVIYDHNIPAAAIPTTSPNYTLVYDNYNSSESAANQNDVYVALEFVNGGAAFWGRDNLIPSGGVFYLVAKLTKPGAGDTITWPTDHQIPPVYGIDGVDDYTAAGANPGESKQIARIFIQDFMTTANFKIGATSLQNAYYSVPDLRASQMSLGLSVDLQWSQGLVYDIDL